MSACRRTETDSPGLQEWIPSYPSRSYEKTIDKQYDSEFFEYADEILRVAAEVWDGR